MTFSEWGPDEETKYLMGWVLLGVMLLQLLTQFAFALCLFLRYVRLYIVKFKHRGNKKVKQLAQKYKDYLADREKELLHLRRKNNRR